MMGRLIDADEVLQQLRHLENLKGEYCNSFTAPDGNKAIEIWCVEDLIENAATIQAGPAKGERE